MVTVQADSWLSDCLEVPTVRVCWTANCENQSYAEAEAVLRKQEQKFCFIKIDCLRTAEVNWLLKQRFELAEVHVRLQISGEEFQTRDWKSSTDNQTRIMKPGEADRVIEIAGNSFRYSRFHLDPQIDQAKADRIKAEWMRSYAEGRRGNEVLVAEVDGVIAGFLAVMIVTGENQESVTIDLMGVDPAFRQRGVGKQLVEGFVQKYGGAGRMLNVGTQIANLPSLRLYEGCGFRVCSTEYVLHRHPQPVAVS